MRVWTRSTGWCCSATSSSCPASVRGPRSIRPRRSSGRSGRGSEVIGRSCSCPAITTARWSATGFASARAGSCRTRSCLRRRVALLEHVVSLLGPASVEVRYPSVWLGDRVWATHGHYLNRHLMPISAWGVLRGGRRAAAPGGSLAVRLRALGARPSQSRDALAAATAGRRRRGRRRRRARRDNAATGAPRPAPFDRTDDLTRPGRAGVAPQPAGPRSRRRSARRRRATRSSSGTCTERGRSSATTRGAGAARMVGPHSSTPVRGCTSRSSSTVHGRRIHIGPAERSCSTTAARVPSGSLDGLGASRMR